MAKRVQRRRGTTTEHGSFTGAVGEISVDTTKDTVAVHDGSQAGGFPLAREDMNNVTNRIGITQLNCSDGSANQFLKTNGSGTLSFATVDATTAAVGGDLSGTVGNAQIVANSITGTELNNQSVSTSHIVDANINAAKLATDSVTTVKILDANITTAKIANSQITSAKILDGTIVADDLASNAVSTIKILDGNITSAKLAADCVTNSHIADASLLGTKLANNAVTTLKIANANITREKLIDNVVDHTKIKDDFIPEYTDTDIALLDRIIYADASDSSNTKQDTVDGIGKAIYALNHLPAVDHSANGPQCNTLAAGYTTAIGDLVYLSGPHSLWAEADADATGTSINMLGIALEVKAAWAALRVALPGSFVRDDSWGWSPIGAPLYMSNTPGAMTVTKPTGSGDIVRTVGYVVTADIIFFNPSSDYITIV